MSGSQRMGHTPLCLCLCLLAHCTRARPALSCAAPAAAAPPPMCPHRHSPPAEREQTQTKDGAHLSLSLSLSVFLHFVRDIATPSQAHILFHTLTPTIIHLFSLTQQSVHMPILQKKKRNLSPTSSQRRLPISNLILHPSMVLELMLSSTSKS